MTEKYSLSGIRMSSDWHYSAALDLELELLKAQALLKSFSDSLSRPKLLICKSMENLLGFKI